MTHGMDGVMIPLANETMEECMSGNKTNNTECNTIMIKINTLI